MAAFFHGWIQYNNYNLAKNIKKEQRLTTTLLNLINLILS